MSSTSFISICRDLTSKTVCNDINDALKEGQEKHFEILYYRKDGKLLKLQSNFCQWFLIILLNHNSAEIVVKTISGNLHNFIAMKTFFRWLWCHKVLRVKMSQNSARWKKHTTHGWHHNRITREDFERAVPCSSRGFIKINGLFLNLNQPIVQPICKFLKKPKIHTEAISQADSRKSKHFCECITVYLYDFTVCAREFTKNQTQRRKYTHKYFHRNIALRVLVELFL